MEEPMIYGRKTKRSDDGDGDITTLIEETKEQVRNYGLAPEDIRVWGVKGLEKRVDSEIRFFPLDKDFYKKHIKYCGSRYITKTSVSGDIPSAHQSYLEYEHLHDLWEKDFSIADLEEKVNEVKEIYGDSSFVSLRNFGRIHHFSVEFKGEYGPENLPFRDLYPFVFFTVSQKDLGGKYGDLVLYSPLSRATCPVKAEGELYFDWEIDLRVHTGKAKTRNILTLKIHADRNDYIELLERAGLSEVMVMTADKFNIPSIVLALTGEDSLPKEPKDMAEYMNNFGNATERYGDVFVDISNDNSRDHKEAERILFMLQRD